MEGCLWPCVPPQGPPRFGLAAAAAALGSTAGLVELDWTRCGWAAVPPGVPPVEPWAEAEIELILEVRQQQGSVSSTQFSEVVGLVELIVALEEIFGMPLETGSLMLEMGEVAFLEMEMGCVDLGLVELERSQMGRTGRQLEKMVPRMLWVSSHSPSGHWFSKLRQIYTQSKEPEKGGRKPAPSRNLFCSANCLAPNPNGRCSLLSFGSAFFFNMLASMFLAFSKLCLSSMSCLFPECVARVPVSLRGSGG